MKKTKKNPNHRGLTPPDSLVEERRADGYELPAVLAERFGVSLSTIYSWVKNGKLAAPEDAPGKAVSFKHRGVLWVLAAAVEAHARPVAP